MTVAKFERNITSLYEAFYVQPQGPLGCVRISVDGGNLRSPGYQLVVSVMPRDDAALTRKMIELGDATYQGGDTGACMGLTNKAEIEFFQEHGLVAPGAEHSSFIKPTTLNLGTLMRGGLLDAEVAGKITRDLTALCKNPFCPSDVKTTRYAHELSPNRN